MKERYTAVFWQQRFHPATVWIDRDKLFVRGVGLVTHARLTTVLEYGAAPYLTFFEIELHRVADDFLIGQTALAIAPG